MCLLPAGPVLKQKVDDIVRLLSNQFSCHVAWMCACSIGGGPLGGAAASLLLADLACFRQKPSFVLQVRVAFHCRQSAGCSKRPCLAMPLLPPTPCPSPAVPAPLPPPHQPPVGQLGKGTQGRNSLQQWKRLWHQKAA